MLIYEQTTGRLRGLGDQLFVGYSGYGRWKNNPDFEFAHTIGPVPAGRYTLSYPFDDSGHGKICFDLSPKPGTETFGRSGLMVHGDYLLHRGSASHGCIVLPHDARQAMAASGDRELEVIEGIKP